MNMIQTFWQTSRLINRNLWNEAERCVTVHGKAGAGDPVGAANITQQLAAYVAVCVGAELVRNPDNILAQQLNTHYEKAFKKCNNG